MQERFYARPPLGWMEIVERAEFALAWCSDTCALSGIRDLAATAEPDLRAMAQLVDAATLRKALWLLPSEDVPTLISLRSAP